MPDKRLDVYMDGVPAGTVTMTGSGNLSFAYDEGYRTASGATPLSLSMPKAASRHRQRAVLPFLQGLLPDNEQALGAIAASHHVSARSPFALLQHVGRDVAGALQFVAPEEGSDDAMADRSAVTAMSDDEMADDLRTMIDAYRTGRPLAAVGQLRMSLAGAQPKIALVRAADGTWGRPSRGAPTTHILKPEYRTPRTFADEQFHDMTVVEMFSLAVARHVGLPTPDAWYWQAPDGDLRALVLQRYDRHVGEDGLVHRDHQEDLCQALSVPPEKKYQQLYGGPGVGSVGELVRLRVPPQDSVGIARDFLALLTLNIAMVNTDAHAKNYSLMLRGDTVALAPAYDILSIALYVDRDDRERLLTLPMRIGNTYEVRSIYPAAIAAEGTRLGLSTDESRDVVDRVLAAVPGALELARQDVVDVPGGLTVADTIIRNLRAISPLYAGDGAVLLTDGTHRK
jgi:serine/threonine-protein kinase HipA